MRKHPAVLAARPAGRAATRLLEVRISPSNTLPLLNRPYKDIAASGGPNGSQKYLNCGIDGSGWNPPDVQVNDLVVKDLNEVRNNAFKPCTDEMVSLFYKYGSAFGGTLWP